MIMSAMLASDKTHLTNFSGDKNVHAVYISLGNIHKSVRNKPSRQGWILLAKVPTSKFPKFSANLPPNTPKSEKERMPGHLQCMLFHKCMRIVLAPLRDLMVRTAVDASGYEHHCIGVLMAWLADLEEQYDILGIVRNSCTKCFVGHDNLDTFPCHHEAWTGDSILT